jgi:hypothetical protein
MTIKGTKKRHANVYKALGSREEWLKIVRKGMLGGMVFMGSCA